MNLTDFADYINTLVAEGYGNATVVVTIDDFVGEGDVIALDQHVSL